MFALHAIIRLNNLKVDLPQGKCPKLESLELGPFLCENVWENNQYDNKTMSISVHIVHFIFQSCFGRKKNED